MQIELKILDEAFYAEESNGVLLHPLCDYMTEGSAAVDIYSTEDVELVPGDVQMISTGIAVHIDSGWRDHALYCTDTGEQSCEVDSLEYVGIMGTIVPRSGMGTRGLVLANSVGIIDSDYQGEIKIAAWNRNSQVHIINSTLYKTDYTISIKRGDRIAQMIFIPYVRPMWKVVKEFSHSTERGGGSFGSTGK